MAHNITQRRGSTASSFQRNGIPPHRNGLGYPQDDDSSDEDEEELRREEEEQERLLSKRHGEAGEAPSSKKRESTDAEIQAEYARRANKRSRPTLTTAMLMGPKGLVHLQNGFGSSSTSSLDATARYSRNLIYNYKQFCFDLFPSMAFEDVLLKMESLGSKKEIKSYLQTMRQEVCKRHLESLLGETKAERMMEQLEHGMKQQEEEEEVTPVVENPYHTRGQHAISGREATMESNEQVDAHVGNIENKTDETVDSDDDQEGINSDKQERGVSDKEAGDEEAVSESPEEPLAEDAAASNEERGPRSTNIQENAPAATEAELDDSSDEETELLIVTGKPTNNSTTSNDTETRPSTDGDESENKGDGLGFPSESHGDSNGTRSDASSTPEKTMDEATSPNKTFVVGPVFDTASGESAVNVPESKDVESTKNPDDAVLFNNETKGELQIAESPDTYSPSRDAGGLVAASEETPTICPTLSLVDGSMESNETATIVPTMSTLASQNDSEILSETPTVVGTMSTQASQFEGGDENKSPLNFSMSASEAIATGTPSFPNEQASETATNP